jgi:dipicolinate synthase subunit B
MHMKNIFFVPFGQDDFEKKPCSMIARTELLGETIAAAMEGRQLQPVLI